MMIPRRNGNGLDFWDEVLPDSFFTEKETKIMKTDLKEKDGKYLLEIDVPGYDKEDIKIECNKGNLKITAEKHSEKEENNKKKYLHRERKFYEKSSVHLMASDYSLSISKEYSDYILGIKDCYE